MTPSRMTSFSKIRTLTKFFARDLLQTRVARMLVVIWGVLIIASFGSNVFITRQRTEARAREYAALVAYLETRPNYSVVNTNFITRSRPVAPYYPLVTGAEYAAPDLVDLRFRESPAFYYGDDVDPTSRLFRPLDLPFIVGIVGFLITLLIGHDAINFELENGNARFLSLFGVRLWHLYIAKTLVLASFLCGSFALVFPAGVVPVLLWGGSSLHPELGRLALLCGLGVVYLLFSVACICALSAIFKRRATAFLAGAGIFLLTVYVVPNTAVFIDRLSTTRDEGAVAEKAQAIARELHVALDVASIKGARATDSLQNPTSQEIFQTLRDAAIGMPAIHFGPRNNARTIALNVAELKRLHQHDTSIVWLATPASPYMAASHAMTIVAGTSIDDDFRLATYTSDDLQKAFMHWPGEWPGDDNEEHHPNVEKWIFGPSDDTRAKPGNKVYLDEVPELPYPNVAFKAAAKQAMAPGAITLAYAVFFWIVGLLAARRLGRSERC